MMNRFNDNEVSSRPRQLIHDAQQHAYKWHEMCIMAHQDVLPEEIAPEYAERMYHAAALNYWKQLQRFKDEPHVGDRWSERPLWTEPDDDGEPVDVTLDDVGDRYRFRTRPVTVDAGDITRGETPKTREVPVRLSIEQATRLVEALDEMAHDLAFDAQPGERVAEPQEV